MNFELVFADGVSPRLRALGANISLAEARALNRTIQTARTLAVRTLAEDVGIPQREVRKSMALRRATLSELAATLAVTGRRIPLIAFGARQTRAGVSYRLRGGRDVAHSAFIATMRSGHTGVFRRRGRARLPIDELRGPSLPFVFGKRKILEALRAVAEAAYRKNLEHEVRFLLREREGEPAELPAEP